MKKIDLPAQLHRKLIRQNYKVSFLIKDFKQNLKGDLL
jgi:hypothetical protein